MSKRKKSGVRSTKNINSTIGDKGIFNRSTGTKVYAKLKSPEAKARLEKVKEFIAHKSKFIKAEEFAGKGKILEILDIDTEANGKFGESVQFKFREPKNNTERIWNTSSTRALRAVTPLLEKGISLIHVWTTGTGTDTMYYAKEAGKSP
jgi:hypothetical protein